MLVFHGAFSSGPSMEGYTGLTRIAHAAGFVVAYPTANGDLWNLSGAGPHGGDDVAFVSMLLDGLEQRLCVDPARVYATGVSNGAGFTARLGCELGDRLAAIAPVAGIYGIQPPCHPARPLSVLEVHGTSDPVVPYGATSGHGHGSVRGYLALWRRLDGCPPGWQRRRLSAPILMLTRTGCRDGTVVSHVRITGGGHTWPGTPFGTVGPSFPTSRAVLQFFIHRRISVR